MTIHAEPSPCPRSTSRSILRPAMWAVRASQQMTYREIGALFGYTASHARQAVCRASERMATDDNYRQQAHDVAHLLWFYVEHKE